MAGVYARGKSIRVQLRDRKWKVELKPTKANLQAVARKREEIRYRLEAGENFDDLIRETQGAPRSHRANTLGYYAQHYFDVVAPDKLADSTLMGYESAYNAHWLPFDNRPIDQIAITELQRHLSANDLAKKTRAHVLSVLRLIYACAVPEVFLNNPIDNWTIPKSKRDQQPDPDPYDIDERDRLLTQLEKQHIIAWRYFVHGFGSGMRTGEILGAAWHNYDAPYLEVKQEMVRRDIRYHTKTKAREVLLPSSVVEMLSDNPTRFKKGLIHLTPEGRMFKDADWLMKHWNRAHDATGVRRRTGPYPWRSTYISMMLSEGINEYDVARWVGNSPEVIRKNYHRHIKKSRNEERLQRRIEEALR